MKKILPVLVLISFLAVLLLPMVASAQPIETCTLRRDLRDIDAACRKGATVEIEKYGFCCLIDTVYYVTNIIFFFLVSLAGLFVIYGGLSIMMAAGDPEKIARGRDMILWAMVGLIVGFLARAIPAIAKLIAGA